MSQLPSKSKTVLWVLLTAIALPAFVYAGESFATGATYTAAGAAVVGAVALVAFTVSYLVEFPAEDDLKEAVADVPISDKDVERVAGRVGDVIEEETAGSGDSSDGSDSGSS